MSQTARKTGDYGVLSNADLRVLALTLSLDKREKERKEKEKATQKDDSVKSAFRTSKILITNIQIRRLLLPAQNNTLKAQANPRLMLMPLAGTSAT